MPNFEKAKDGKIKVTSAKFNFDGGQDVQEIKNEGLSPTIRKVQRFSQNLRLEVESFNQQ